MENRESEMPGQILLVNAFLVLAALLHFFKKKHLAKKKKGDAPRDESRTQATAVRCEVCGVPLAEELALAVDLPLTKDLPVQELSAEPQQVIGTVSMHPFSVYYGSFNCLSLNIPKFCNGHWSEHIPWTETQTLNLKLVEETML